MKRILSVFVAVILFSCTANKSVVTTGKPVFKKITQAMYSVKRSGKLSRETALEKQVNSITFYDKNGEIIKYKKLEADGTLYEETFLTLNKSGKATKAIVKDKNGDLKRYWITEFDTNGNRIALKTYDSNDELLYNEKSTYDEAGNEIENILENKQYGYTNTTKLKYNAQNQLIERTHYNGAKDRSDKRTYEYDEKGNEIKQFFTNADGRVTTFISEYDKYDNLLLQNWYDESGRQVHQNAFTYTYDEYGNWITRKRSRNDDLGFVWERKIEYQ